MSEAMHLQETGAKADQPNMFTAATELVPFLVCWEFEETLKDYFLVCFGLQNRAAFED